MSASPRSAVRAARSCVSASPNWFWNSGFDTSGPSAKDGVLSTASARISSRAPRATPRVTLAIWMAALVTSGIRSGGTSTDGSPPKTTKLSSSGTNAPLATTSWLPVPHSPDTDQVSLISTSLGGSTIMRTGGSRPSSTTQWPTNQWACWQPLANAHRPVTR